MGFIRGTLVTLISVVLLLSLFLMSASLTLAWSLEYDTIQPALKESVKDVANDYIDLENAIQKVIPLMQVYCEDNSEYVFSDVGQTFVILCETINSGSEAVVDYGINYLIESVYYQEYDCDFWQCVKETDTMFVLVSEKAHDYWKSKFYIFLLMSIALFALIFFLSNRKSSAFLIAGALMVVSVLPLAKVDWILSLSIIPEGFLGIITSFFTRAYNVFLIMLIIGILLFLFGISLHFFGFGKRISNWFSRNKNISEDEVKKIVKKEVGKK